MYQVVVERSAEKDLRRLARASPATAGSPMDGRIPEGYAPYAERIFASFVHPGAVTTESDVAMTAISDAWLDKLLAYKRQTEWTFPWASLIGSDFNFSHTEEQQREEGGVECNYQRERRRRRAARRSPRYPMGSPGVLP